MPSMPSNYGSLPVANATPAQQAALRLFYLQALIALGLYQGPRN